MRSVGQEILQKSTTVNYKTKRRANKTWSELGTSVIDMFMFDVAAYPKTPTGIAIGAFVTILQIHPGTCVPEFTEMDHGVTSNYCGNKKVRFYC